MRDSCKRLKNTLVESLQALGGPKKKDSIDFIKSDLVIKHKESGVEYTVVRVLMNNGEKPSVLMYRYYGPNNDKKLFIKVSEKDFNKYSPV